MSDFNTLQQEILQARTDAAKSNQVYLSTQEKLRKNQAALEALRRIFNPNDPEQVRKKNALETEQSTLKESLGSDYAGKVRAANAIGEKLGRFSQFGDPPKLIENLEDNHPILLFPLRLETRFKTASANARERNELWVRIYPDECQVETFTEVISETELKNIQAFWIAMWKAGGWEDQQRAAWRSLVQAVGTGRASWLLSQYKPVNEGDHPSKADPHDLLLIFAKDPSLSAAEEGAAQTYWSAYWLAGDDPQKRKQVYQALETAVGAAQAVYITGKVVPPNLSDPVPDGMDREAVQVKTVIIQFPAAPPTSTTSWNQAPAVRTLPEQFLILGYQGSQEVLRYTTTRVPDELQVGPDPSLPQAEQMKAEGDNLVLNQELKWLNDFNEAVSKGMGARIPLTQEQATSGFEKLIVIGIRYSTDAQQSAQLVEKLFTSHYHSGKGFGLLPQGTPTNNTSGENAGYFSGEDADVSYDLLFKNMEAYVPTDDDLKKCDGQWLGDGLGISHDFLSRVPHAAGHDQMEARAINMALWPATMGYFLDEMMTPAVEKEQINTTREFFNRYVLARGTLPALRIGKQPYGVLPATAFSRLAFERIGPRLNRLENANAYTFLNNLLSFLRKLDTAWDQMMSGVAYVGKSGDPYQLLLDIVGLHPSSVEYYQRYAESFQQLFNEMVHKYGPAIGSAFANYHFTMKRSVLAMAGLTVTEDIPLLDKYFLKKANLLKGFLIDDQPLSEINPVRAYTPDKKNYLTWLRESSLDKIRRADFGGNPAPTALLYLWLRHALLLSYWDGGVRLYEKAKLPEAATFRMEPNFIHIQQDTKTSASKWSPLYQAQATITGDPQLMVADYISDTLRIRELPELSGLHDVHAALEILEQTPTARLERLFAEHMDSCTYRLDAWKNGLINYRLQEMHTPNYRDNEPAVSTGLFVGAYGYLEQVKPEPRTLSPVQLSPELSKIFTPAGEVPPVRDSANAGFIHAPSIAQASAAAVMKSAYLSQADASQADTYSINLTADRVRRATAILEGIRNGQSLSALLGYQFERGLHDRHNMAEVDKFIYPLRKACPLVADKLKETQTSADVSIESIEARNVLDGLKLVNRIKDSDNPHYPFGFADLPAASVGEAQAIDAEAVHLLDTHDAVADLMLSESVYQVIQGNFDRAAANADVVSKGGYPPETAVIRTPRTGKTLTQRLAVHFDAKADPNASPWPGVAMTPRATSEAPVNDWLSAILPAPDKVLCQIHHTSHVDDSETTITVSQKDLGLQPIDGLFTASLDTDQAMTELDDRIRQFLIDHKGLHPLDGFRIAYTDPVAAGNFSFFEVAALIRSLRKMLLESAYVKPTMLGLTQEQNQDPGDWDTDELKGRIDHARDLLEGQLATLQALQANMGDDIDLFIKKTSQALAQLALFGLPQTGWGYLQETRASIFSNLAGKISTLVSRWEDKQAQFAATDTLYAAAATAEEKEALLVKMESCISAQCSAPVPANYRQVVDNKKAAFDAQLLKFKQHLTTGLMGLQEFISAVKTDAATISNFDAVPLDTENKASDLSAEDEAVAQLRATAQSKLASLIADIQERSAKVGASFDEAEKKTNTGEMVDTLLDAAKQVLGEPVLMIPRFRLGTLQGEELGNALQPAHITQLLQYQHDTQHRKFPLDDWLASLARVKEKMFHWENIQFLTDALSTTTPSMTPIQLPFQPEDSWLALDFPADYSLDGEKMLYTVSLKAPFNAGGWHCGLLVEEWTEVIPSVEETTGISFHYDKPNTEPPQAMLLMVPPVITGHWKFADVVDGILETFTAAKKRAVEPSQVEQSPYGQFLPATIMAVTLYQITIATNLAINNKIYETIIKNS